MKKLTKHEAILILVDCAWQEVRRLQDQANIGPDGIEVYLTPRIKQLCSAINVAIGTDIKVTKKRNKK